MNPLLIPCPLCAAKPGEHCNDDSATLVLSHEQRRKLAEKLPDIEGTNLDATDKAMICYYAYIMLCDSVAANSEKMFGKEYSSRDLQKFFARQAVVELRKDGLLK
jgi:hypothetical protein